MPDFYMARAKHVDTVALANALNLADIPGQLIAGQVAGVQTNGYLISLVVGVPTWTAPAFVPSGAGSVTDETTLGIAPVVGVSTNYARQDHTHGSPTAATIATGLASYFQPLDAGLTSLTLVDTAADLLPYTTAANTWAATALTAFARTLLDDVDQAAMRTTLGLGTIATFADAPSDGNTYGRNNGAWAVAGAGSIGTAHALTTTTLTASSHIISRWAEVPAGIVFEIGSTSDLEIT